MRSRVVFVLKGYPRLSETFIAQEILALERRGLDITIIALRRPTDKKTHPITAEIKAAVRYLPEYLHDDPGRVFMGWRKARRLMGYRAALKLFLADLGRETTRNRIRRFGQALVLAAECPEDVGRLHAHFIHTPASVTRYASVMLGLPWSISAHAKDIWTTPEWDLAAKLAAADFTVTCTKAGRARLNGLAPPSSPVRLVYHGLDLDRFRPLSVALSARNGAEVDKPVRILTVCRAVPKKGLDTMIAALAALPAGLHWRWIHVGGGELAGELQRQAERLGIAERCAFRGSQAQDAVLSAYRDADIFALPCRITGDGDRDGLPNVLMEAASQSLPLVSSPVSDVAELVIDGETGLVAPVDDAAALAERLARLIADPALRSRLGKAARRLLETRFDHRDGVEDLAALFGLPPAVGVGQSTV